jgi:hypothetical protein
VTSRAFTAQTYAASAAHVVRVIPTTPYRFCWSPKISDLLFAAKEMADAAPDVVMKRLADADYQESDLEAAHAAGHEVMLFCDEYVAIPVGLLNSHPDTSAPRILLPG